MFFFHFAVFFYYFRKVNINRPSIMNKFYHIKNYFWRNLLAKCSLVVLTVLIVVWFLPRNDGSTFRYDVGRPWMYGSFIAQFDFPIYKTDETLKAEQDSLLQTYQPYYNYDKDVERQEINKFLSDNEGGLPGLPAQYKQVIVDRLHRLYQAGIMQTPEYNRIARDSLSMVRVVSNKAATSMQITCLYSTMSAYEQLFKDETLAPVRMQLQHLNLNDYIEANLEYDRDRNEAEQNDLLSSIPQASGMVLNGQKIVDRGEIVDEHTYRVLSSFEKEMRRRNASSTEITTTVIGQALFVLILVVLFTTYLNLFRHDYFEKPRSIAMIYLMITIFPVLVSLMMSHNVFSVYILPFAMAPMFIRVFMDSRTAFIAHVTMVLICAAAVKYQYEFIIVQLVSGLVAIYSLRELSQRSQIFKSALFVTLGSCAVYFAMQLMQSSGLTQLALDQSMYYHFCVNGVLLLLAYPMMWIMEKMFGFTSNVTLFELSNTNKGLLRQLSEVAPGTFQHSITVGNLAAEIANRIGADSLLVRTGALYHDIGKMANPVFFTENQNGIDPHKNLTNVESAQIIIGHVSEGVKMAEKANLPTSIKDFILTHHGRGMAKYFYIREQNGHPDEIIDKSKFTYPGPNPFTREQAVLMMADTVEAASRSLPEYTEENITDLVNRLIDKQVDAGFFRECPITFRDIAQAKQVLTERLKAIYHTRIQYPELKK